MEIGIKIKECREKMNISQKDLANYFHINPGNVGMWESGKNNPKPETIVELAKLFNTSTDYLLGVEEKQKNTTLSEIEDEILKYVRQLSLLEQGKVLGYAKARAEAQSEIKDIKIKTGYRG